MTKAAARSVSTMRKASAWSLAVRMLMPRWRAVLASLSWRMLVLPEVETTVFPLRSSILSMWEAFLETNLLAVRK